MQLGFESLESRALLALTFNFNYVKNDPGVGFDNSDSGLVAIRKAAIENAAATFGSWFSQTATLNVDVYDFRNGPLDSVGFASTAVANNDPGFLRTVPQVKVQDGNDLNGVLADGDLAVNWEDSNPNLALDAPRWNYTDNVGANQLDFKSEVMQSLTHLLGFESRISQAGEDIFADPFVHAPGEPGTWVTYDKFLSTATGEPMINPTDFKLDFGRWFGSVTSGSQPTTGLFFNGPHAAAANGGAPVAIYSPGTFTLNQTASHVRASANVDRTNSLMVGPPELGGQNVGPLARKFSAVEIGIMRDLGYAFNVAPIAITPSPALTVAEDSPAPGLVIPPSQLFSPGPADVSGQTVTFTGTPTSPNGTVTISGGNLNFVPATDFFGNTTLVVTGQGSGASTTATFTVSVTAVNDAPVPVGTGTFQVSEDPAAPLTIAASSVFSPGPSNESSQTVELEIFSGPQPEGTAVVQNGSVLFTPTANFFGQVTLVVHGFDNGTPEKFTERTLTINVLPSNDSPIAVNDALSVAGVNIAQTLDVLGNDSPGLREAGSDTIRVTSVTQPSIGSVSIDTNGANVLFTPPGGVFNQQVSFTYTITDGGNLTSTANAVVNIRPPGLPFASDDKLQISEDSTPTLLDVLANDFARVGSNAVLESIDSIPPGTTPVIPATQGSLAAVGNFIDFTPAADFFGQVALFTYRMNDDSGQAPENGSRQIATVTVVVSEVNDAPVASAINRGNVLPNVRNEFDLTEALSTMSRGAPNESAQTLRIVDVGRSTQGVQPEISPDGLKIFYTAPLGTSGNDSFSYTVEDNGTTNGVADVKRSTASVSLSVSPFVPSSFRGSVYVDDDINNRRDPGDLGMGGVDVFLRDGEVQLAHDVTDAQGRYSFEGLPPGTFTVSFVVPSFMTDSQPPNFLNQTIAAQGGVNVEHDFALLGLIPGYGTVLENLASSYYQQDAGLRSAGLVAVMGADGKSEWTLVRGGGFETDTFHEVVVSDDRRNAYITAVRGPTNEVFTATLNNRRNFVVVQDPQGRTLIRVIARSADLTWTKINPAAPPVLPARKYFAAVEEFLGPGSVMLNPPSTVAPIILVSKDGQPTASLSVTASGGTNTFAVALNAAPVNGNVVLKLQPADSTHVRVTSPAPSPTLTFTSANWHIPQTVTVQGKNDGTPVVQNHTTKIDIAVDLTTTTATNYRATLPQSADVETIDNVSSSLLVVTGSSNYALTDNLAGQINFGALPTDVGKSKSGVPVALGDVTGDGIVDTVLGSAGEGLRSSVVTIINGATQQAMQTLVPYPDFAGQIFVAVGDVDGDGRNDLITGPGADSPPIVKIFNPRTGAEVGSFPASTSLTRTGATVAAGDIDGDGIDEIITGDAAGTAVRVFNGQTGQKLREFTPFAIAPGDIAPGINVAAGDLDGDGKAEIVTALRPGGQPLIRVFEEQTNIHTSSFFAFAAEDRRGVSVAVDERTKQIYAMPMTGQSNIRALTSTGQPIAIGVVFGPSNDDTVPRYIAAANNSVKETPPVPEIRLAPGTSLNRIHDGALVTNASRLSLIVDFGKSVTGFSVSDLQIEGATAASFTEAANGLFRFDVDLSRIVTTINIAEGAAKSLLGMDSAALPQPFMIRRDNVAPRVVPPEDMSTSNANSEKIEIFVSESEKIFDVQKLTATNGDITDIKILTNNFEFTITPTTRGQPTIIAFGEGFATDLAGNKSPAVSKTITFTAPTAPALIPKLTSFESTSTTLASVPFTVDFGTPVNGIATATPEITNGSVVGEVQHSGNGVYTFIVQPQSAGELKVRIPAGRVSDAANATRLNVESNTVTLQFSSTAPKPEILPSAAAGNLVNGGSSTLSAVPFQVIFSAPVDGFRAEDIQITGGTIANFAGEDSQPIYTFDVIPNGTGQISLSVPAGVAKDVDQTDNLPSAPFTFQSNAAGDVTVTVQSDPSTARAGADIFYLVSVKNHGLGTVSNVNVTAALPADLTFVPITGFLADPSVSASGQNISITIGNLPAAAERFFTVQVKLNQNAAVNSTPSITFNVTGTNDGNPVNNAATIAKTVLPAVTGPIVSATVEDAINGGDVTVSVPGDSGATISNLVSTPILSVPALVEAAAIPVGVNISATSFNVNLTQGGTVVVTLRPPGGVPANATFMKYGKLPGGTEPTVYPFLFDGNVGAKLFPDRIEIHLKDGAKGDNDGIANGVIVDPGFVTSLNPFAPYQSTSNSLDVDGNGSVEPLDALLVINELNRNGSYTLPSVVPMPVSNLLFLDTSGDGEVAPIDVLLVINSLNRGASGESEPTTTLLNQVNTDFKSASDPGAPTTSGVVVANTIIAPSITGGSSNIVTTTNSSKQANAPTELQRKKIVVVPSSGPSNPTNVVSNPLLSSNDDETTTDDALASDACDAVFATL